MIRFAIIIGLCAGCGGKKSEEPPPSTASGSQTADSGSAKPAPKPAVGSGSAAGSGSAVAAAPADPELPTAEDFEEEANARITEKNLDTEVKAIEKEIGDN